jgi:DNA replication protein DnaC
MKQLRMGGLVQGYRALLRDAEASNLSYPEFLKACLEHELASKQDARLSRLLAQASFPVLKTIATFDFSVQPELPKPRFLGLLDGGFVRRHESVILVGKPGTGKTHLAIALGVAACQLGLRTKFYTAASLANHLVELRLNHALSKLEKHFRKLDLVILDELGYVPFSREAAQLLFSVVSARYERSSFVV